MPLLAAWSDTLTDLEQAHEGEPSASCSGAFNPPGYDQRPRAAEFDRVQFWRSPELALEGSRQESASFETFVAVRTSCHPHGGSRAEVSTNVSCSVQPAKPLHICMTRSAHVGATSCLTAPKTLLRSDIESLRPWGGGRDDPEEPLNGLCLGRAKCEALHFGQTKPSLPQIWRC